MAHREDGSGWFAVLGALLLRRGVGLVCCCLGALRALASAAWAWAWAWGGYTAFTAPVRSQVQAGGVCNRLRWRCACLVLLRQGG